MVPVICPGVEDDNGVGDDTEGEPPWNKKVIKVSRDQVSAARALIELRGGVDKVDPLIAKVAQASPPPDRKRVSRAS